MAEKPLGKMIIELGMDAAKFNKSLNGIKSDLKVAQSAMKANVSVLEQAGDKYGALGEKVKGLGNVLDVNKRNIDELRRRHEEAIKTFGEESDQVAKLANQINTAVTKQVAWERQLQNTNQKLLEMEKELKISNSMLGKFGNKMQTIAEKTDKLSNKLTKGVTPAIGGLGLAIGKVGLDADTSSAKLQNAFGLTAKEAQKAQSSVTKLWSDGFGSSISDVTEATRQVKQNIRDLNDRDLTKITKQSMVLAETFDSDINEVTRAGNNLMKGFGVSSEKAMDLMTVGAQKGLNMSNEMFDNLTEYTPLWSKMGYSAEEMFNTLISASNEGVYNLDFVNDAMKEFQIRLKDGSKTTSGAMKQMSNETQTVWKSFLNGKATVKDVNDAVLGELKGMSDQVQANQIGVGLYGTKWEDLESKAMYSLGNVEDSLGKVDGAAQKVADTTENTFKQETISLIRGYGKALTPLGNTLIDIGKDVLPPFQNGVETLSETFNGMSEGAKKTTLVMGGLALAAGPALKILSPLGKGIGLAAKGVVLFKDGIGQSKNSLNLETIALDRNTAALQRNNTARNGDNVNGGTRNRRSRRGSTIVTEIPETNSRVARNASKIGKGAKALKYVKGAGAIGAVVGVGTLGYELATGSGTKESIGGSIGGSLGGIGGGAALGAAIGSVVPGIGTAIGTVAGGIIGGIAGDKVGSSIGKMFDSRDKKEAALKKAEKDAKNGASLNLNVKGISTSTQATLKEYDKLYQGAKTKLNQIMMSNTVVNKKIKDDTVKQFTTMKNSVLASTKERHQRERVEAINALNSNKNLSKKEKEQALADLDKKHQSEINKINNSNARINQIMSNASKNHRALTRSEKEEIKRINDQMYNTKIKKTAKSEQEITRINKQRSKQRHDITTKEMNDTINKANNEYTKTVKAANKKYQDKVRYARIQYKELGVISKDEYNKIVANAKSEKDKTITHAKNKRDSVVRQARSQKDDSVKASKDQKNAHIKNAQKEASGVGKAWNGLTGFLKSAVDWVKGLFGNNSKTSPAPSYSLGKGPSVARNAKGTHQSKFKGGLSWVGEEGPELAHIPGQGLKMVGVGGQTLMNLPSGTAILPNDKTIDLLSKYHFPGFAKGTGDDSWFEDIGNLITGGTKKLWTKLTDKFNYKDIFPRFFNAWAGSDGVFGWAKGLGTKFIKGLFNSNVNYSSSAGVEQWRLLAMQALKMTGQFSMDNLKRLLMQMSTESGGNPKSINLWDSNAKKGIPSKGLMQVIDPTFRAYAMPGYDKNIYDPLSNILASIRYSLSRYGSLRSAWRGVGYENGGIVNKQHLAMVGEGNKPEAIIPLDSSKRSRAIDLLAQVSTHLLGGKSPSATTVEENSMVKVLTQQMSMMQQQINLLTAILAKDTNVYLDSREIKKGQERLSAKEKKINTMARGLLTT